MPFDSRQDADQTNFRTFKPLDGWQTESFRIGAAPTFFAVVDTSYETLERTATFAYRTHALNCCPCGQDHSAELLAHKISLSTGNAGTGVRLVSEGTQYAPDGSPQRATVIISGEVGSTPGTAGTLAIGDTVISQIEISGDQDWYAVQLEAGVTYEFSLSGTGGNALSDPFLEIMSSTGVSLKTDDDGGAGLNSLLRYTPTASGTFYVNAHGWANTAGVTSTGSYALTATQAPPLPTYTINQIADYLVLEGQSAGRSWAQTNITYNIEALTPEQQVLAERALQAWSAVTPLTFTRTTGTAGITFRNTDPDPAETGPIAYAQNTFQGNAIISSTVVITSNWQNGDTAFDSYTQQAYIHEVGHALGLGHAGPYNGAADWGTDNVYTNDSWAYTVMSYFDQLESGHGSYRFVLGLQQADIVAIQQLYGVRPGGTNPANTTYGFNSTAPGTNIDWSQFVLVQAEGTYRRPPSMTIYDTGGIDTINLSGFSQPQILDLRPGTFSSLGDRPIASQPHYSNVIAIEANTIIENAVGGAGNDRIIGNSANNTITLGAGADTFVYAPGGGADTITDFAVSVDRIDLTGFSSAAALTAFNGRTASGGGTLLTFGAGQTILLQGVSTGQLTQTNLVLSGSPPPPPPPAPILGTSGNDVIYGTEGDDVISGLAGHDTIYGLGGNDVLNGDEGDDNLWGGPGADTLNGGAGNDNLYGDNLDTFNGGDGYDTIWIQSSATQGLTINMAVAGVERIYGSAFADNFDGSGTSAGIVLYGFGGADTLIGGTGNDYLYVDYEDIQSGLVRGGAGYDYIIHQSPSTFLGVVTFNLATLQVEGFFGSAQAEIIDASGNSVFATIYTGGGADIVTGSAFNDRIFMDNDAVVNAGAGYDYVIYNRLDGSGANFNLAAMNAESAIGRDGNDVLDASGVTTSFVTLYGYGGADTLLGGSGNDYIYFDAADLAGGQVQGGAGYDYLINHGGTSVSIVLANHTAEGYFGASSAETISAAGLSTFATIFSGGGADTIIGSAYNDTIYITNSVASVNAGAGYDYVVYELLDGSGAANWNLASMGAEGAIGRDGNDTFDASGVNTFATLYGYGGNDTLTGGAFNDAFYGGTGNDTMTGNGGSDSFVFENGWGSDTITDFTVGADRMLMRVSGLTQFNQLSLTQSGADTLIGFGGQQIRLLNVTAATITAASFQFLASAEPADNDAPLAEIPDSFDFSRLAEAPEKDTAPVMELPGNARWPITHDSPLADRLFADCGPDGTFVFELRHDDVRDWDIA